MRAREIMTEPIFTVHEYASLEEIARLMLERDIGSVPVVDDQGRLRGIVTEADFQAEEHYIPWSVVRLPKLFGRWLPKEGIERVYEEARSMRAVEIMSTPVVTVTEEEPVRTLIDLMLQRGIHHIPVVREGRPVGMVSRHDLLRMMARDATRPQPR